MRNKEVKNAIIWALSLVTVVLICVLAYASYWVNDLEDKNNDLKDIIAERANYIHEVKVGDQKLLIVSKRFDFDKYPYFENHFRQFFFLKNPDAETKNFVIFKIADIEYDEDKNPTYTAETTEKDFISAGNRAKSFAILKVPLKLLKK